MRHRDFWVTAIFVVGVLLLALGSVSNGYTVGDATGRAVYSPSQPPSTPPQFRCVDADGDGYFRNCGTYRDCSDLDARVSPGMAEVCDYMDNDCNGLIDEGC